MTKRDEGDRFWYLLKHGRAGLGWFGVAGGRGGFFVLYVIATVASYEQLDNSEKLASKNAYLPLCRARCRR